MFDFSKFQQEFSLRQTKRKVDGALGPQVKRASTPTSVASFGAVTTDSSTACWRLPAHQNLSSEVKTAGVHSHSRVSA